MRRWTPAEWMTLCLLVPELRPVDAELADLVDRLTRGEAGLEPQIHDRLLVCGRPELADRLRRVMAGRD